MIRESLFVSLALVAACSPTRSTTALDSLEGTELTRDAGREDADASGTATTPPVAQPEPRPTTTVRSLADVCDGSDGPRLVANAFIANGVYLDDSLGSALIVDGHCNGWVIGPQAAAGGPLSGAQRTLVEERLRMSEWASWGGGYWPVGCCDGPAGYVGVTGFSLDIKPDGQPASPEKTPKGLEDSIRRLVDELGQELPKLTSGPLRVRVTPWTPADSGAIPFPREPIAWPLDGSPADVVGSFVLAEPDAARLRALFPTDASEFAALVKANDVTYLLQARPLLPAEPTTLKRHWPINVVPL